MNEIACPNKTTAANNHRSGLINSNECDPDAIMIKLINNNNNSNNNNNNIVKNGSKMFREVVNKEDLRNAKGESSFNKFDCASKASSTTSSCSDISEDEVSSHQDARLIGQDNAQKDCTSLKQLQGEPKSPRKTARSMSEGQALEEPFEVFPSLPDSVLEKLGLLGDQSKTERINEDEMEHKFVSLSLAFTIDAATIPSRSERQRRYRDQTEANLSAEIERLIEKVHKLQPLCVDAETTELLASLLAQVDVIVSAADHAAIAAERFGAIQHEERLADSVQLMINHVSVLKKQRDATKRQLQYTKRVLQDTHEPPSKHRTSLGHISASKSLTRRRASIATISQSHQHLHQEMKFSVPSLETRRLSRRTSDLSVKSSVLARMPKPLRLELGLDLVKINEGVIDTTSADYFDEESLSCQSSQEDSADESSITSHKETKGSAEENTKLKLWWKLLRRLHKLLYYFETLLKSWLNNSGHELFTLLALMSFCLGFILLANILVELESEKQGYVLQF